MSSILLLLDDGEAHPLVSGGIGGGGHIVSLPRGAGGAAGGADLVDDDHLAYVDITNVGGDGADALTLGNHFLNADDLGKDGEVVTKIEVENVENVPVRK